MRLVGPDGPVALFLLELVGGVAADVPDLDPGLLHPLVDDLDEVLATIFGERRDVQPDDGPVDVGNEPDVALLDRLLDRAQDAPVPGLDHDLVRLRHADPGELVERRLGPVVVDRQALHERRRRAAGPDALEVALHRLDRAGHLLLGRRLRLRAHAGTPPTALSAPEMRVPTGSPTATLVMLSGWFRSNQTIGRSFSMHSDTAAASRTLSWSRRRSAYCS